MITQHLNLTKKHGMKTLFKLHNIIFVGVLVVAALVGGSINVQAQDARPEVFVGADGQATDKLPSFGEAGGLVKTVADRGYAGEGGTAQGNIQVLIGSVIKGALTLLGSIFLILMVYGGYNWMVASGDSERVKLAKDSITRAIVGLSIVLGAYAITNFVVNRLATAAAGVGAGG